jgi:GNAT superfamily N-acetyltransferase
MTYRLRPARPCDQPAVEQLWADAAAWLASIGSDQWQYPPRSARIAASIVAGTCWLVDGESDPVATITLDDYADPDFWRAEDGPDSAMYVHRLIVARAAAGAGIGSALLDWASGRAEAAGRRWLRADCWRTNAELRVWYEGQAFGLLRVVDVPHRRSGALYQRRAGVRLREGPALAS